MFLAGCSSTGNVIDEVIVDVRHVTGTGSGLLGGIRGIPRVVVQMSALTLKGPLKVYAPLCDQAKLRYEASQVHKIYAPT
jgi:hypothetical protein